MELSSSSSLFAVIVSLVHAPQSEPTIPLHTHTHTQLLVTVCVACVTHRCCDELPWVGGVPGDVSDHCTTVTSV